MPGLHDVTTRGGPMAQGADLAWVADALVERREDILSRWRDVTTRQPFHMGRRSLAVADHIPDLLERVIGNLVSNALKYSPPEQSVEVTVTSNLESVTLSVADHGIGIAEDELPSLFTRYGRTASAVTGCHCDRVVLGYPPAAVADCGCIL